MELRDYLTILWRRKWIIALTFAVTIVVVIAGTLYITPIYRASAKLRVATASGSTVSYSDYMYADRLLNTYVQIASSRPVLDELIARLNLVNDPKINVEVVPNTELISVAAENPNPQLASNIANTLAEILVAQSSSLYAGGGKSPTQILQEQMIQAESELAQLRQDYEALATQTPDNVQKLEAASQAIDLKQRTYASLLSEYEDAHVREEIRANTISIVEPAIPPLNPAKPNKLLNILLASVVGLMAGLGLAFVFENLDTTLYTTKQIETVTAIHSLGKIPFNKNHADRPPFNESFRRLRTNILMLNHGNAPQSILMTSAQPDEGKSTIMANLAVSIAQAGKNIVVVDGDMYAPTIHKTFNLSNRIGLSNLLKEDAQLDEVIQKTNKECLYVITSGPVPLNPVELLGTPQMPRVIQELKKNFDFVLIDTPAMNAVTDAAVLAPYVDCVLLVVQRTQASSETVQFALKQFSDVNITPAGVIINRAEPNGTYYYRHKAGIPEV